MPEYVRVRDKDTGHKYSVITSALDESAQQVLKQDAVDNTGEPLPPEFNTSGQSADTTKEKTNG